MTEKKQSGEVGPAARPPQQRFLDPGSIGQSMGEMKQRAEEAVAETSAGDDAQSAYLQAALEIHRHMRPRFGPANGWLFNERSTMLERLARKLGLDPNAAATLEQPDFDGSINHLEGLLAQCAQLGLEVALRPSDRAELSWTRAPGFAVLVVDPSRKTPWRPSYAGTSAGPEAAAVSSAHRLTLFVYPRYEGTARMSSLAREQPGSLVLYTGSLLAYTLQEPQSHDVKPDELLSRLWPQLEEAGLSPAVSEATARGLQGQLGSVHQLTSGRGIIQVSADGPPPEPQELFVPAGCALLWMDTRGVEWRLTLSFPAVRI